MNLDTKKMIENHLFDQGRSRSLFDVIKGFKYKPNNNSLMWPAARDYFNPFNPVELFAINDLDQLAFFPFVFVRDGFFSLMHFFSKFKIKKSFKTILIIHRNFFSFIPREWEENIWYFDYYVDQKENVFKREKNKLLVKFNLAHSVASLDHLECCLKRIKKIQGKREIFLYMPVVHNSYMKEPPNRPHYLLLVSQLIYNYLNDVTIIADNDLNVMKYRGETFIDINEKFKSITDDFMNYFFLSKGIMPEDIEVKEQDEDDLLHPFSPYHGIRISDDHPKGVSLLRKEAQAADRYLSKPSVYFYSLNTLIDNLPVNRWRSSKATSF